MNKIIHDFSDKLPPPIELNYFAEVSKQFQIKYTVNESSVSFYWKRSNTTASSYKPLGVLRTRVGKTTSQIDIFSSERKSPLFIFHIVSRNSNDLLIPRLDPNLFDSLFSRTELVALIASNDGYLYWSPLLDDNSNKQINLLSNTLDPIVYINSFSYRNDFDLDNCLYVLTKSGKLCVYSYFKSSHLSYKISILSHFINSCAAFFDNQRSTHYLVYSTSSHEIYIVRLFDCLKNSSMRSSLLRKFNSPIQLAKDKNNQVVIKTQIGSETLDIKSLTESVENDVENQSINKQTIKENLEKLCKKSNEVVKYQQKLDKLNFVLKQINQIETIRTQNEKNRYFEVNKRLKIKPSKQVAIEVELKNKSMSIENNDSYYLFVCVKFENSNSYYWTNKCERLWSSLNKVDSKHLIRIDATEAILNRLFLPAKLKVYLVYDVDGFLSDVENSRPFWNEFSVCLHESDFELDDFFSSDAKSDSTCLEASCDVLWHLIAGFRSKFRPDLNRLEDIWTGLSISGISMESNTNDLKTTKVSKTSSINPSLHLTKTTDDNEMKISIHFSNFDSTHLFRQSLANMIQFKNKYLNKYILKVNGDIKLNESQKAELNNLFETFNQLVASKIANVEKSLVEESFQMMNQDDEMHEKEAMIDIETAFQILTIYLNLRKIIYSNIKLN